MIQVLHLDNHVLFREGLKELIKDVDDIEIAAEASSGDEAIIAMCKEKFDLVMLEVTLPGLSGVELIETMQRQFNCPPILVLTMHNEPRIAIQKLKVGASGFITKSNSSTELFEAIRKVAVGGRYLVPDIAEKIAFEASSATPVRLHELLSGRELLVLRMFAKGKKVGEIADEIGISHKTVSSHKTRLMQKMHIANDVDLIKYAMIHLLST
jgi:DNA-binding NarL/FixJ family response regulator